MLPEREFARAVAALAVTLVTALRRRRRDPLRHCPRCAADAVRASELIVIDEWQTLVGVQCGQCGVWRRILATERAMRLHRKRLGNDRRAIEREVQALEDAPHVVVCAPGLVRRCTRLPRPRARRMIGT